MQDKTLIGKNNYLFLINDSCKELEVHCNNLSLIKDQNLSHLNFKNYMLIVFPNKSLYYKEYLPDQYLIKFRPAFDIYKNILKEKILDGYESINNNDYKDLYYKTDAHMNLKGSYIIYLEFIKKCNLLYNANLTPKVININVLNNVELSSLNLGLGDLTWPINLGSQVLEDKKDNYYYSDDIVPFYMKHSIKKDDEYVFYDYNLIDVTNNLENHMVYWNIISKYIIYKKNNFKNFKVIIFYDSFLLSTLPLYMELFHEVYMIKKEYNNKLIELIKPDYVFEFRVERFLL